MVFMGQIIYITLKVNLGTESHIQIRTLFMILTIKNYGNEE